MASFQAKPHRRQAQVSFFFAPWRLCVSLFASHGRKAHADDAAVFRGRDQSFFADVRGIVRRCFLERKSKTSVRRFLPKNADFRDRWYNENGITEKIAGAKMLDLTVFDPEMLSLLVSSKVQLSQETKWYKKCGIKKRRSPHG